MDELDEAVEERYQLVVDGESVPTSSGETISVVNPAIGSPFASVAAGGAADVDRAVDAARDARSVWCDFSPAERGRVLSRMAAKMRADVDNLARLLTRENGKPLSQAKTEVEVGARYFEYYAGLPDKIQGDTVPLSQSHVDYTLREPLGVIGHIVPWNFPISLFARSVAPALAAGNTTVVKPAEQTPVTAVRLGQLLSEVGLPDGGCNVVPGYGADAGAALSGHDDIDGVAFTGSVPTGKEVAASAARNLTPVHIEAGGKNPNVVFPDADLDVALEETLISIFTRNAGQVCSAGDRLLVHEDVHEEFVERLVDRVVDLTLGPGVEDPDVGALVSKDHYENVRDYVDIGIEEAGEPLVGGHATDTDLADGYFVPPTIFDDVDPDARIAQEEIFGPVLSVIPFEDEAEAIEISNGTEYGLVAGIFTSDVGRAHRFARDVRAGQVYVNEWFAGGVETPFGGFDQSGFGREKGLEAIDAFTATKNVCLNIDR